MNIYLSQHWLIADRIAVMPIGNLFFFTGDNTFLMRQELTHWKDSFHAKYGSENSIQISAKDTTFQQLLDAVSTMPFLSAKRIVFCEEMPPLSKPEVTSLIENIHPDTVIVIADLNADTRLAARKEFLRQATVKEFRVLTRSKLIAWVQATAKAVGTTISPSTVDYLMSVIGEDQWMLHTEIQKLALSCVDGTPISESLIDQLSIPSGSQVVWRLTDLVSARKYNEAITFLERRLDRSDSPYDLWIPLLSMIRTLAAGWAASQEKRSLSEIALHGAISEYALRPLVPLIKSLTHNDVSTLVNMAVEYDIALKTGELKYSTESPLEMVLLMQKLILACASPQARYVM